jgi:hypothetical protein
MKRFTQLKAILFCMAKAGIPSRTPRFEMDLTKVPIIAMFFSIEFGQVQSGRKSIKGIFYIYPPFGQIFRLIWQYVPPQTGKWLKIPPFSAAVSKKGERIAGLSTAEY